MTRSEAALGLCQVGKCPSLPGLEGSDVHLTRPLGRSTARSSSSCFSLVFLPSLSHFPNFLSSWVYILSNLSASVRMSNLLGSLGRTGRRSVVLGHTLNILQCAITRKSHNILSKFTILCWAAFIAILGRVWPLDQTP